MASNDAGFAELMHRWREGNAQAAREIYERFGPQLLIVVRRKLADRARLRRRLDSQDLTQSVWGSILDRSAAGREFQTPRDLVRFLAKMAQNKLLDAVRETRDDEKRIPPSPLPRVYRKRRPLPVPTPSQEAMAGERWKQLLADQPPHCQRILHLLRDGCSHDEIAAEIGMSPKIIQRLLRRLSRARGLHH